MTDKFYVLFALLIALAVSSCTGGTAINESTSAPGIPNAEVSSDQNSTTSGTSSGTQSVPKEDDKAALKKKLDASRPGTEKDL